MFLEQWQVYTKLYADQMTEDRRSHPVVLRTRYVPRSVLPPIILYMSISITDYCHILVRQRLPCLECRFRDARRELVFT